MKLVFYRSLLALAAFALLLSACQFPPGATETPLAATDGALTPSPAATSTSTAPRILTVCLGQEPNSLYPFASLNGAARSVLSAIYDGPIDVFSNGYQPVILEKIPSLKNGDAELSSLSVKSGDQVVDVNGDAVVLEAGVTVLPSGCSEESCAVKYDGRADLEMDQIIVTFRLLPNLLWSDATPLTADDSVYAFNLAANPATPGSKYLIDRTQTYEAVDEKTLQWWGKPGFVDPTYADNIWTPLPKHAWEKLSAADLAQADTTKRPVIGWGPYIFAEWSAGEYIRLDKNPNYFRAEKDFPKFDTLMFRFMKDAEAGISGLIAGQCDVLDTSLRLDGQINLLTNLEQSDQVHLVVSTTPLIERLDFGIRPASYDNGYAPASGDRIDFFGDVRTRQGIAFCLDRQKVIDTVLAGLTVIPDSFVPATHSLYNDQVAKYPFDLNKGNELLEEAGWVNADNDPSTPRTSLNVTGVPNGTPLVINYRTTSALQRRQVSEILSVSLTQCGIQVNIQYDEQNDFYAQGPDGPLFGRQFDLAEYAIGVSGTQPPCLWFLSSEIPTKENNWLGVNVSGYSNTDYDALCKRAMRILPDSSEQKEAYDQVQVIFGNDLPSVPLYQRIKVAAARKDLCNFSLDSFSTNDLWNIEEFDYGPACGD